MLLLLWLNWLSFIRTLINVVHKEMVQGFIGGISPQSMCDKIHKSFENASNGAVKRLVRTEVSHFNNEAAHNTYKELGIEKYQILVSLEEHTCGECSQLDGEVLNMKDYADGSTAPPFYAIYNTRNRRILKLLMPKEMRLITFILLLCPSI